MSSSCWHSVSNSVATPGFTPSPVTRMAWTAWRKSPERWLAPDTIARAARLGLSLDASLARNDGHGFFEALGDGIITGPTLTNVNDFRAILIV